MAFLPDLTVTNLQTMMTSTFMGLNRNIMTQDGEMSGMKNLSSSAFPVLSPRGRRSKVNDIEAPGGMLGKDALAYIDGNKLHYGGLTYPEDENDAFQLREDLGTPRQLVSMGAYLCIWPDKMFFNTEHFEDRGSMEERHTTQGEGVTVTLTRQDGTEYNVNAIAATAPENPNNGMVWIDTSGAKHSLRQYNGTTGSWDSIATVFLKISSPGIGHNISDYDVVRIDGIRPWTSSSVVDGEVRYEENAVLAEQLKIINGEDMIIYQRGEDYLIIAGILDYSISMVATDNAEYRVEVYRHIPDCDYITECNNRLWGCRYGWDEKSGKTINEIYACALGDFKNWYKYLGISTDSYAVSVGTDGIFTGAVTLRGNPLFFKENCVHKVSGTSPSTFTMNTTMLRGVQEGSSRSLCIVDENLIYKGRTDIMIYDGSLPVSISAALGGDKYYEGRAGAFGGKYYISMRDRRGEWGLYVYDTKRQTWHQEDDLRVEHFTSNDDSLYAMTEDAILDLNGEDGEIDADPVEWEAVFGVFGYQYKDKSYLSRFNLCMRMAKGDRVKMYIQYDSDGEWHYEGTMEGKVTRTFMIPVIPRRCDHCQLKLTGVGDVRVISIAREYEAGGDG